MGELGAEHSSNNGRAAARLRLAPFGYGPVARPQARETLRAMHSATGGKTF